MQGGGSVEWWRMMNCWGHSPPASKSEEILQSTYTCCCLPTAVLLVAQVQQQRRSCKVFLSLLPPLLPVQVIRRQLAEGVSVRRVGFVTSGPDPAHQHSEVLTPEGHKVGEITSGAFSPCL